MLRSSCSVLLLALALVVALAFDAAGGTEQSPAPGSLIVADSAGKLIIVDPDTGDQVVLAEGGDLVSPLAVHVEATGTLLVGDAGADAIFRVDLSSGDTVAVSSGDQLNAPSGITTSANGDIWVADVGAGAVLRIDATGAQTVVAAGGNLSSPTGIALDSAGDLIVTNLVPPRIVRVDSFTGATSVISAGDALRSPFGVAIGPSGALLIADAGAGAVIRIDPTTGDQVVLTQGASLSSPYDLVFQADGSLIVVDRDNQSVVRVDASSGAQTSLSSGGELDSPYGIAVVSRSVTTPPAVAFEIGDLVVVDRDNAAIWKIDAGGETSLVAQGGALQAPDSLVLASDDTIFVSDPMAGAIVRIRPASGEQTVVALGAPLDEPRGLLLDGADLLVADVGARAVLRVSTEDGSQTVVSQGGGLLEPTDLARQADGTLLVVDASGAVILAIDPTTGNQTSFFEAQGSAPSGIAAAGASVFVSDSALPALLRLNADGSGLEVTSAGGTLRTPDGIAIGQAGEVIVADPEAGAVIAIDRATGIQSVRSQSGVIGAPTDVAVVLPRFPFTPGAIYFADTRAQAVVRVLRGGSESVVSQGDNLTSPTGLLIDPRGWLIVTDIDEGSVIRIDPGSGAQQVLSSGGLLARPVDLVFDANRQLLVSDLGSGAIVRVAPDTGVQSVLTSDGFLESPYGLAMDTAGQLYVTDPGGGVVIRVDPTSGDQTLVIQDEALLNQPLGIAIDEAGKLLIAESFSRAVVRVDPQTGEVSLTTDAGSFVSPRGVAFESAVGAGAGGGRTEAGGRLIVSDFGVSTEPGVLRVDPTTGETTVVANSETFKHPSGIAVVAPEPLRAALTAAALATLVVLQGWTRRRRCDEQWSTSER